MSQPVSNQNEPSKMNKLLSGNTDVKSRLPQATGTKKPDPKPVTPPVAAPAPVEPGYKPRYKFLPAFWTIASIMSFTVNIILLIVLGIALQMLGTIQTTANDQFSGLLGGLYNNFVRMDNATIRTEIPVKADIPLDIMVPVKTTTRITLASETVIPNAHVLINTGGVNINADATVTLPKDQPLDVNLDFPLQVTSTIPISLNVKVEIPLKSTELSGPFQGLQAVVKPYYCLVEPNALMPTDNQTAVCAPPAP